MLTPREIRNLPLTITKLYRQAANDILVDVARRIGNSDLLTSTGEWQIYKLKQMGFVYEDIVKRLSKLTGKSQKAIKFLYKEAIQTSLTRDDKIYAAAGLQVGAYSKALQNKLNTAIKSALIYGTNLTKSTALNVQNGFGKALDRAFLQVSSGAFSVDVAKRQAVNTLLDSGVSYVEYRSGKTLNVESAIQTNLTTSLKQTTMDMSLQRGEDLGWRFYQVSAHSGCAPDHYWMQGEVFEVDTIEYIRALEDLQRPNCRHSISPYLEGISSSSFDVSQTARQNEKQYRAEQESLYKERMADKWKTKSNALKEAGLDNSAAYSKYKEWSNK